LGDAQRFCSGLGRFLLDDGAEGFEQVHLHSLFPTRIASPRLSIILHRIGTCRKLCVKQGARDMMLTIWLPLPDKMRATTGLQR
jgi:hypothetical protein